jgi:hypothetical protein
MRQQQRGNASVEPPPTSCDAVGEAWQPEDPPPGPAWRDMDGPARLRRAGRILTTVAVVLVAVGALSYASSHSGVPGGAPAGVTSQQSEAALPDGVPTESDSPFAPASADTLPPKPRTR